MKLDSKKSNTRCILDLIYILQPINRFSVNWFYLFGTQTMLATPSIYEDNFIINTPDTISTAATTRMVFTGSPKMMRPTRNAPTAPIPVQIV